MKRVYFNIVLLCLIVSFFYLRHLACDYRRVFLVSCATLLKSSDSQDVNRMHELGVYIASNACSLYSDKIIIYELGSDISICAALLVVYVSCKRKFEDRPPTPKP